MARVVIHIGAHKTGTTYLQQGFVALRPALLAAGIDYPTQWQEHLHGHHSLVRELAAGGEQAPAQLAALAGSAARKDRCLLLSSENFELLDDAAVGRLASALRGHAVEIVYFARHWSGLLPSAWQEQVKQGGSATFPEFLLPHLTRPWRSQLLNPVPMLGRYAACFGRDAIRVVAYDEVLAGGRDLLDFFLARLLAVRVEAPSTGRRINQAMPATDIEIIRLMNAVACRWEGSVPGGIWPMRLFYELGREGLPAIAVLRDALRPFVIRHAVADDIAALCAIATRTLEEYGPAISPEAGASLRAQDRHVGGEYVASEYWMHPAVPEAFAALRDAVRRRHAEHAIAA